MEIRTAIVTGSEVVPTGDGAEPGRVLQAIVTDLVDVQNVATCQAGDEYHPPNGVMLVLVAGGSAYKLAVALDDGVAPIMAAGGKRIYSTDATGENVKAEVRCHPDGKLEVLNDQAALTILPDGTITVANGAAGLTLAPSGVITFHGTSSVFDHPVTMQKALNMSGAGADGVVTCADVTFNGISAKTHKHGGVQAGASQTGVPV